MARFAFALLVTAHLASCSESRCAPGEVPNEVFQACVRPVKCDGGVVNERNECMLSQAETTAGSSGTAGEADGGHQNRDGDLGASGAGMSGAENGSGHRGTAGRSGEDDDDESPSAPRCGDGAVEALEKCDGNCPTQCDPSPNKCIATKLAGDAQTCDAECVSSQINDCIKGDGCCPMGCTHATDEDCSPSCGDGVLSGTEKCEPGSADHPCPTTRDCDDGDPCTEDLVAGGQCSAECAHMPLTRTPMDCDDRLPCTEDSRVESASSCGYECIHSEPRSPTGSCRDDDPCTDDTPTVSATRCAYECPHQRQQPMAAECDDDDPCTDDTPTMSRTQCAFECPHSPSPSGTPCGNGMTCSSSGRCEPPPERCGDGVVSQNEECDPAAPGQVAGYTCNTSCRRLNRLTTCNGPSQCEGNPASKCDIPGICRPLCSTPGALCEILPGATRNESSCTNGACAWLCTVYEGVDAEHCGPNLWCDGMYCRVKP